MKVHGPRSDHSISITPGVDISFQSINGYPRRSTTSSYKPVKPQKPSDVNAVASQKPISNLIDVIHRASLYDFVRFFLAVNTVIIAGLPLPALVASPCSFVGGGRFLTAIVPYMYEWYVSREATGSGNGLGDMSTIGLFPFTRRGGGVCGGARVLRIGSGSGVCRPDLSAMTSGTGFDLSPSHNPRMVSSITLVDHTAFSTDGNS